MVMDYTNPNQDFGAGYQPTKTFVPGRGWMSAPSGGFQVGSQSWQDYQKALNPEELTNFQNYQAQQQAKYNSPYGQANRNMAFAGQGQTQALNNLAQLMQDPSKIQQSAGYQFAKQQGEEAINRSAAARGMLNSGNVLAELAKYGQGMASQEYGNQVNRLSQLANAYGQQQGQAQEFLLGANAGPYQSMGLNPGSTYYGKPNWAG